jgi:hypothetical protein
MIQMQMVENGKVTNYFSDRYVVNQTKIWDDNHFVSSESTRWILHNHYRYVSDMDTEGISMRKKSQVSF